MSQSIRFTKMHGAGNDYVYINGFDEHIEHPEALAVRISDRHFGIGSDGLVLILPSDTCDFRMRMFNADGTEAEMCGNATRCVGKYVYDHRMTRRTEITLETKAGVKILQLYPDEKGGVRSVRVNMGQPRLKPSEIPVTAATPEDAFPADAAVIDIPIDICGKEKRMTCVNMGNPHAVYFVDNVAALDLPCIGPAYENHPRFPHHTNTEFVEVVNRNRVRMRVWERGAGETLACGTGCCATLAACVLNGKTDRHAIIELLGGELEIEWDEASGDIFMTGPATTVFEGIFEWGTK